MNQEPDLAAILKRYVQVEDNVVARLSEDLKALPSATDESRRLAKERVLKAVELHVQADVMAEEAVARFREALYIVARQLADEEIEPGIITPTHIRQAQSMLARRHRRYGWGDGLLAFGGLLLGSAVPHVISLGSEAVRPSLALLLCGLLGALLLGMGVIAKAKD